MITTKALSFGYSAFRPVLHNISLKLDKGHIHGLLGCNGIGKTTLLKLISGIMRPQQGEVRVDGIDPALRRVETFRELMIIPEEFDLPNISLEMFTRVTSPFYPRFDMGQMRHYCEEFHVNPNEKLHSMSMGQRKKAYISFALACNVQTLLLDEPTNDLDIITLEILEEYLSKFKGCVIIISHDRFFMDKTVDHIFVFEGNGVIKDFPGNYSDYREWKTITEKENLKKTSNQVSNSIDTRKQRDNSNKLTFKEKKELEALKNIE